MFLKNKKLIILFLVFLLSFTTIFSSCNFINENKQEVLNNASKELEKVSKKMNKELGKSIDNIGKEINKQIENGLNIPNQNNTIANSNYDELQFTDYYAVNGEADIVYDVPTAGEIVYGELDNLNRPTYVIANLNYRTVFQARKRGRLPIKIDPIGWNSNNDKVEIKERNGQIYHGYFYNRSHMLADSLGGKPIYENLITGTRTQNVGIKNQGGMAYTEIKAREFFVKETDEKLIYQVRNIYNGNDLLPRYVLVDIKSTDGKIDEQVVVDNSANGFVIDYSNGSYSKEK